MRWRFTGDNRSYGTWHAETELALVVWGQIRPGQVLERVHSKSEHRPFSRLGHDSTTPVTVSPFILFRPLFNPF